MMNDGRHFGRRPFLSFFVSLVLPPRPPTTAIILLRCIYTTILDLYTLSFCFAKDTSNAQYKMGMFKKDLPYVVTSKGQLISKCPKISLDKIPTKIFLRYLPWKFTTSRLLQNRVCKQNIDSLFVLTLK